MSKLGRIVSLACAAAMLVSMFSVNVSAKEAPTAMETVNAITAGWNLGNSLDSCGDWIGKYSAGKPLDYETAWGNPVTTRQMIAAVKKAGFNAVRVPVTWAEHIDSKGNIDKEWLARVHEVVDYVMAEDMYCVLNVHHDGGTDGWLEASEESYKKNRSKFEGLWKNIAASFKDYGDKLIFESFNEMLDKGNTWNAPADKKAYKVIDGYNQTFVDAVRSTGGKNSSRCLMLQVYSAACGEDVLKNFTLPADSAKDKLIVQVHNYDPQGFTWKDATWTTMTDKWGSVSDKKALDDTFARLGRYSDKWGVPIVVGEFASEDKGNDDERAKHASYFVTKAAEYGIKCFWWDTGGMAVIDRKGCKVSHPKVVKALTDYKTADGAKKTADKKPAESSKKLTVKYTVKNGSVTLSWSKVTGADSYKVYKLDKKTGKYKKISAVKGTSYKLGEPAAGKYKVTAVSVKDGKSVNISASDAVKVTV